MIKWTSKRDKDLKYDFLPSAIEIVEKPASPLGSIIIYIIASFIVGLLIWACIFKIDEVTLASGVIVPKEGVKVIDSNLNGMISDIYKKEGDKVKVGDKILELENINSKENEKTLEEEININKLELEIINRKIDEKSLSGVYELFDLDRNKKEEIKMRESIEEESKRKDIQEYNEGIVEIEENIRENEEQINELTTKYEEMDDVEKFISGKNLLSQIKDKKENIENLKKRIEDNKYNQSERLKKNKLELIQKRNSLIETIDNVQNNLDRTYLNNKKYTITSPITGVIQKMNYNTIGSYINQSKGIAEVVPSETEFQMETYISNADVAKVQVGQDVTIKMNSFDYQIYGTLTGKIDYIYPNATVDDNNNYVYKAIISFAKEENENIEMLPGMMSRLEIKTGKIRIIDYFLKSFRTTVDESFKG